MNGVVRLGVIAEYARGSLWILPSISVLAAAVLGVVLAQVQVADEGVLAGLVFPGGAEGARGMLQAVAASVITVTSLVFSLTVVTLQLASSQFSPRLLRTFLRRPGNQIVMSIFLATFVYSLVVLRTIRADDGGDFVPALAVSVAFLLVLCSVGAIVYFIHHITSEIRADTLMNRVEEDTLTTIGNVHPDPIDLDRTPASQPEVPADALPIPSTRAGIVQAVAVTSLLDATVRDDVVVVLAVRVGDRVVRDGALAWAWRLRGDSEPALEDLAAEVNDAVAVGRERTMQQDVSYGLRQLVDMAAKALSTGMNDPTTAVDATGHLMSLLTVLARRHVSDTALTDEAGRLRVYAPQHDFHEYLEIACGQIRRYGSGEPAVMIALLELLREVAVACVLAEQRDLVKAQLELVIEAAQANIAQEADRNRVLAVAEVTREAAEGRRFARLRIQHGDVAAPA